MSESQVDAKKRARNRRIGKIVAFLIRVIGWTLRVRYHDRSGFLDKDRSDLPVIFATWHSQVFVLPLLYRQQCKSREMAALTSASRDGETVSAVVESFKIRAVRGSNSRRGAAALIELKNCFKNGQDILITPDGPRGPRHELNGGVVILAQKTKGKLIPLRVEYRRAWRLKTWDRFEVPWPFSRVDFHLCPAINVPPTATPEEFEAQRLLVQSALRGEENDEEAETTVSQPAVVC